MSGKAKNRSGGEATREHDLRARLRAAEETIRAIRSGKVDALVMADPEGSRVLSINGADNSYRVFVEAMAEGALTVSYDGTILYSNPAFAQLLESSVEELAGTSFFELIAPSERPVLDAVLRRARDDMAKCELSLSKPGGKSLPVLVSMKSFREYGARAICLVVTNLSEQKRNEEIVAAGKLTRLILEQAAEAVAVCDVQGRVILASQAMLQLCGGNPLFEPFDSKVKLHLENGHARTEFAGFSVDAVLRGRSYRGVEVTTQCEPGIRHFLLSAAPLRLPNGDACGCVVTLYEIEELKQAQEALRKSEKLAATGRLAAAIAHEINNPLEAITNLLYLIQSAPGLDERGLQYARLAQDEISRVAHITRQTLAFNRESTGPSLIDVSDLVKSVISLYASKLELKRIRLEPEFLFRGKVRGYSNQLRQVISNLLLNAVEASPSGARLRVRVKRAQEYDHTRKPGVHILFGDCGPGIAPKDRHKLFEPFFTTKGERGTGLGLWVSQGIIHKHGGAIRLRSSTQPRRSGTVFSVFLPLVESGAESPSAMLAD